MEAQINRFTVLVNEYFKINEFQLVFSSFIAQDQAHDNEKDEKFLAAFTELWKSINSLLETEKKDVAAFAKFKILGKLVERIQDQSNPEKVKATFNLLRRMIRQDIVKAKMICEAILNYGKLNFQNETFWCLSFELIYSSLNSIDYKGCRDIFTLVLEKSKEIPNVLPAPVSPQIDAVLKVIRLVLDRNACLLPAYFCINEILKIFPENDTTPHWALSKVLADFVDGFRPLAQLVTVSCRCYLYPIIGSPCSSLHSMNSGIWRLDQKQLTFHFKVQLPYDKDVSGRQYKLLCNIVNQPNSRETVSTLLGLNKNVRERCSILDDVFHDLLVNAMEKCEQDVNVETAMLLWKRLCNITMSYACLNLLNFTSIIKSLYDKLQELRYFKGRHYLMWFILQLWGDAHSHLEQKDLIPLKKLIEFLFTDTKPLSVPEVSDPTFIYTMAVACLWHVLSNKAQGQSTKISRPQGQSTKMSRPAALRQLCNHLDNMLKPSQHKAPSARTSNNIALLLNASEHLKTLAEKDPISTQAFVIELWFGRHQGQMGNQAHSPPHLTSIPTQLLDVISYPAKRRLLFSISNVIGKKDPNTTLFYVMLETYSSLLAEYDIPSIRNVFSQVLPVVFEHKAWGILHNLLEMFSYRLPFIPQNYRVHLMSLIHSIAAIPQTNQNYQLHLCLESTAFRLIQGLENNIVESYFTKHKPNMLVSAESEELNRIFILNIARAIHISGTEQHSSQWYDEILKTIVEKTPMNWSKHTLEHFPLPIQNFFAQRIIPVETKPALKQRVEEEYMKFKNMKSQAEILNYFGEPGSPNIFVCIIWKCLLESGRVNQICLQVLVKLGARALTKQIRVFSDFLIYDYSIITSDEFTKRTGCLHDMVWKYHIFTIDRLVLCLVLRYYESKDAQICNLLVTFLLLKNPSFRDRVQTFVQEVHPEYWKHPEWHQKHQGYHKKWDEKFYFEGLREATKASSHNVAYFPINFGNVCLRFLPVLEVIVHRFIELPAVMTGLESLLHSFAPLFKFHDRPVTFLYNTLFYYNNTLNQRPECRNKLVSVILGAFASVRPPHWCLSSPCWEYLRGDVNWTPNLDYYCEIVGRLVDTLAGNSPFPLFDARFHEFASPAAHAIHVTCVELMCLPVDDIVIAQSLFSVIYKCGETSRSLEILNDTKTWINALALIISSLPESYSKVVPHVICEAFNTDLSIKDVNPAMMSGLPENLSNPSSFSYSFYSFQSSSAACALTLPDLVVAFSNAVWYHSSLGHISYIIGMLRDKFKPLVHNEAQFLFLCRVIGPFLFRFYSEKRRCLLEIAKEFYAILDVVDKKCTHLYHIDTICDFFYHIKYMFVGDAIKQDIQHYVVNLRPVLRNRLQFIAHVSGLPPREELPSFTE